MTAMQFMRLLSSIGEEYIAGDKELSDAPIAYHGFIGEISSCIGIKGGKKFVSLINRVEFHWKHVPTTKTKLCFFFKNQKNRENAKLVLMEEYQNISVFDNPKLLVNDFDTPQTCLLVFQPAKSAQRRVSPLNQITSLEEQDK